MEHSAIKETRPRSFIIENRLLQWIAQIALDSTNGIGSVKTECDRDTW